MSISCLPAVLMTVVSRVLYGILVQGSDSSSSSHRNSCKRISRDDVWLISSDLDDLTALGRRRAIIVIVINLRRFVAPGFGSANY